MGPGLPLRLVAGTDETSGAATNKLLLTCSSAEEPHISSAGVKGAPVLCATPGMKTGWTGPSDPPAPRWTVLKLQKNSEYKRSRPHSCRSRRLCYCRTTRRLFVFPRRASLDEVLSWSRSFELMLRSLEGREVFREFLRSEYSEDNLLFWLACEELKKETNSSVVDEKARIIYEDYVSILSPKEVPDECESVC